MESKSPMSGVRSFTKIFDFQLGCCCGVKRSLIVLSHIFCILSILSTTGCAKQKIDIEVTEIQTTTNYTLSDVFFLDELNGYACGGERFGIGVLLKTFDGGKTWTAADSVMPKQAYSCYFQNPTQGFVVGFDSWISQTFNGGVSFDAFTMPAYLPTLDIKFNKSGVGLMVGGAGLNQGTIYSLPTNAPNWNEKLLEFKLECVAWASENRAFAAGYGVLLQSDNSGETWRYHDKVKGDFFKDICFPNSTVGYLIGWQGMVLKSNDGGLNWRKLQSGNNAFSMRVYLQAVDFFDENTGAIVGENGLMWFTKDGGKSWKSASGFTKNNLYDVHLFDAHSGIACGDGGKVFLFKI